MSAPKPERVITADAGDPAHVHVWVWTIASPGPAILRQRCACGTRGPLPDQPLGSTKNATTPYYGR